MRLPDAGALPTIDDCVHCGLCLPDCPTYRVTGREVESPRGRIAALRGLVENRIEPSAPVQEGLEDCLVCRACESACPSGISMESMMAGYRHVTRTQEADARTRLERWWLDHVVSRPGPLAIFARVARWLAPVAREFGVEVPRAARLARPDSLPAEHTAEGTAKGTVVVFRGCIADHWFRDETLSAARVLAANGWHVRLPESGCCGALHRHAGLMETADRLTTAIARTLPLDDVDSAGCSAALLEHGAPEVAGRITDTMSLLATTGWTAPKAKIPGRWAVFPACHQRHGAELPDGTRSEDHTNRLLGEILEQPVGLPGPELCCGAAGTYGMRRPELSRLVGDVALERFIDSGASGIVTANPGCLLRWESLLPEETEVAHPVTLLHRAYSAPPR